MRFLPGLTAKQRAVIVRVLEALAQGDRFAHYRADIDAALIHQALESWRATLSSSIPESPTPG